MTIKALALAASLLLGLNFSVAHAQTSDRAEPAASGAPTLALVGGRLVDGYGGPPVENAVVLIAGNRITTVGQVGVTPVPEGIQVLDVNGMTILPGLWESHGHLFHIGEGDPSEFPEKFADRAEEVMAAVAKTSLMSGITSFRDTGGPLEPQLRLRAAIDEGRLPGPRLYLAGPILRQGKPQRSAGDCSSASCVGPFVSNAREAERAVRQLVDGGVDQIKVYGFWDLELLQAVTAAAHAAGVGVDADVRHVSAYITAVKAGVDRLHHVFLADPLADYSDEDMRLMVRGFKPGAVGPMANILRGPYMIPTVQMREAYVRVLNFPELLEHPRLREQFPENVHRHLQKSWENPSSVPWGLGAEQRVPIAKEKLRRFIAAGGREQIVAGTDAGSPFNLHSPLTREIRNLHEAGLTAMEAIQSATLRAAQMQGVEAELGTVSPGKLADIVVVDGNPLADMSLMEHGIMIVIKDGEIFRPERDFRN